MEKGVSKGLPWLWKARVAFGLLLGAGFLFLALRRVHLGEVASVLRHVNPFWVTLALGTVLATTVAKAARWKAMLGPQKEGLGLGRAFSVLLIGQATNALLPLRLGEVVRAFLLGELEGLSKAYAFSTIMVEKTLDGLMLSALLGGLLLVGLCPGWLRKPGFTAGALFLALSLVLFTAGAGRRRWLEALERLRHRFPGLERWGFVQGLALFLQGLSLPNYRGRLLQVMMWSLVIWALAASTNYLTFLAFGLGLSPLAALLLLAVLHLGVMVPSSPGQVGVFHYLTMLALSFFSVGSDLALGYAVTLHFLVYGPMFGLAALALWRESGDIWGLMLAAVGLEREA